MGQTSAKTCAECGEAATVFVSLVKGGKVTTVAYCAPHAEAAGIFDSRSYALVEPESRADRRRGENVLRCPACDCSQRDFERQGRFGCPACYTIFAGLLPPLLQRMHRDSEHRGKIPARGADPAAMRHRLVVLQAQLNDAVRTEKFEWAAQTRDAIEAIKAKLLAPADRRESPPAATTVAREQAGGASSLSPGSASGAK